MKLHGTVDRQKLVKYLASAYAFQMKSWRDYLQEGDEAQGSLHLAGAIAVRMMIWNLVDGVI